MKKIFDSPDYLRTQILKFREMMSNKKDWELSGDKINRKIDLAYKGLLHLYIQTNGITDEDTMHIDAITVEFTRRKYYVEMEELKSAGKQ